MPSASPSTAARRSGRKSIARYWYPTATTAPEERTASAIALGILIRAGDRLLEVHPEAALHRGQAGIAMSQGRRADGDRVEPLAVEHRLPVVVGGRARRSGQAPGALAVQVCHGGELDAVQRRDARHVLAGDPPGADHAHPQAHGTGSSAASTARSGA